MNIETNIENLEKKIEKNAIKIEDNAERIKVNSSALGILKEFKEENKRIFIILIIVLFMWFATICYLIYVLNDIGYEEINTETTTQEVSDVDNIDNSYIINGDNYGKD